MSTPRVLFVSKPVVPPFHDGTKCLVRDVSTRLQAVQAVVMATPGAPALDAPSDVPSARPVELAGVYGDSGQFAPALLENVRAALWLLARSRADVWHFVFAPNAKTSKVGRTLSRLRRRPVVQTIASPPRDFHGIDSLLFGDVVVAQSQWTADRISAHSSARSPARRVEVIRPPVGLIAPRSEAARRRLRERLSIPDGATVLTYPGDLEVSAGAETVARAVAPLTEAHPDVVVVFAYRPKTPRAHDIARALERRLPGRQTRFTDALPDVLALVEESAALLFPVDDLWGKVDLPIVLLEAMSLGVPIVTLDHGPLAELGGVVKEPAGDDAAFVRATLGLLSSRERRSAVAAAQREHVQREHAAQVVARRYEKLYLEICKRRTEDR